MNPPSHNRLMHISGCAALHLGVGKHHARFSLPFPNAAPCCKQSFIAAMHFLVHPAELPAHGPSPGWALHIHSCALTSPAASTRATVAHQ